MRIRMLLKPASLTASLLVIASFAGCSKKSGEVIVVAKEYIAAGEERETPTPGQSPNPAETSVTPISATPHADNVVEYLETEAKPLAEDEVKVDGHVMKKDVQGTSKDPRAHPGLEQWRISVELVEGGRSLTVRAKQAQYQRLKIGDRVKVRYSEGNYTSTVWNSEIVD
jgi:hypothetical protein